MHMLCVCVCVVCVCVCVCVCACVFVEVRARTGKRGVWNDSFRIIEIKCEIQNTISTNTVKLLQVQNLLLHFWQGMPNHLIEVLSADILCDIVALCDSILYKVSLKN